VRVRCVLRALCGWSPRTDQEKPQRTPRTQRSKSIVSEQHYLTLGILPHTSSALGTAGHPRTNLTETYSTRIAISVAKAAARDPMRLPGALSGEPS
jgi:hypothetical protein